MNTISRENHLSKLCMKYTFKSFQIRALHGVYKTLVDAQRGASDTFERSEDVLHTFGEMSIFETFSNSVWIRHACAGAGSLPRAELAGDGGGRARVGGGVLGGDAAPGPCPRREDCAPEVCKSVQISVCS